MQVPIKITNVSAATLIPYNKNSRTHSPEQISQIEASIKQFGFLNPVIIDGNNMIIAGHARVIAAKNIGLDKIPTIDASHLTDTQRNTYVIADNKLALNSGWNEDILKEELLGLDEFHQMLTGFSPDEFNLLFNGWISDIEIPTDTSDETKRSLKIVFNTEQYEYAKETITNALDLAGIEYEF